MNKQVKTLQSIVKNLTKEQDRSNVVIDAYQEACDNLSYAALFSETGEILKDLLDVLCVAEDYIANARTLIQKVAKSEKNV